MLYKPSVKTVEMTLPGISLTLVLLFLLTSPCSSATCDSPTPAFPPPNFDRHGLSLQSTTDRVSNAIKSLGERDEYNKTSFSLEVTSQTRTLISIHHTAKVRSSLRRGAKEISNITAYRIASMTKPFTVLAILQQHQAGNLSLDDPVSKYVSALNLPQKGSIPWKHITLRSLATQQSGIPRDLAQGDVIIDPDRAAKLGLPPINGSPFDLGLPSCDGLVNYTAACTPIDLLSWAMTLQPLFAPNQKSSYGNINFELLGLVITNVSRVPYEEYITTRILQPLGMAGSRFTMPPDEVAAVPADVEYYWPFYMGVQNPTGGLYSSSSDMSTWLRHVLSTYNARPLAAGNWFAPTSFSASIDTFYGMPWEIFRARTNEVVKECKSTRPLTFITKSGGLPGYTSIVIMIPEYAIGITILVAGNGKALEDIREVVVNEMVRFAEEAAMAELRARYVGTYEDETSNSSITLAQSDKHGLTVTRWISNGVDTLLGFSENYEQFGGGRQWLMHVLPTLLYTDEKAQQGEKWRLYPQTTASEPAQEGKTSPGGVDSVSVWDNFCVSDWDIIAYAGKPVTEIVFHGNENGEAPHHVRSGSVQLSGFRSTLYRKQGDDHRVSSSQQPVQQAYMGS